MAPAHGNARVASTVQNSSDKRSRLRLGPPPESDLIGPPLVIGVSLAVVAILATFIFIGWPGR